MKNLARKLDPRVSNTVTSERATVVRVEGAELVVRAVGHAEWRARRAVSCLVAPVAGDLVLVASAGDGAAWVLAVLERTEGAPGELAWDGDLKVGASGRVSIAAQEGVEIASGKHVRVVGASLDVSAAEGNVVVERLAYVGTRVLAEVERVKLLARSVDSVLDRLSQRVKRSYRTVEEIDRVKAKAIDYEAEATIRLHAENTVVTSDGLVRVDGDQIHLG